MTQTITLKHIEQALEQCKRAGDREYTRRKYGIPKVWIPIGVKVDYEMVKAIMGEDVEIIRI